MTLDVVFVDRAAITEHRFGFKQVTIRLVSAQNKAHGCLVPGLLGDNPKLSCISLTIKIF